MLGGAFPCGALNVLGLLSELGEIGEREGGGATQLSCNTRADVLYSTLLKLAKGPGYSVGLRCFYERLILQGVDCDLAAGKG